VAIACVRLPCAKQCFPRCVTIGERAHRLADERDCVVDPKIVFTCQHGLCAAAQHCVHEVAASIIASPKRCSRRAADRERGERSESQRGTFMRKDCSGGLVAFRQQESSLAVSIGVVDAVREQ
jgi:hypothetical protein